MISDIKLLAKKVLTDIFSERVKRTLMVSQGTYFLYGESFISLLRHGTFTTKFNEIFYLLKDKYFGDRAVYLELDTLDKFLLKFERIKKVRPVKATVVFVSEFQDVYLISPSFIKEFKDRFGTVGMINGKGVVYIPVSMLIKWRRQELTEEEKRERRMREIIQEINSLDDEDVLLSFFDESEEMLSPSLYLDTSWEEKEKYLLKKIKELEEDIKELKEEIKILRRKEA